MNIEKLKYLTAIIVFVSIIHTSSAASDIDREIARIKSAPPALRVKLMNRLKRKIFRMKREERIRAVRKLRSRIAGGKRGEEAFPHMQNPEILCIKEWRVSFLIPLRVWHTIWTKFPTIQKALRV